MAVNDRDQLAESLRTTMSELKRGHRDATADCRYYDAVLIAAMRRSTEDALHMLTDCFWNKATKTRYIDGKPKKAFLSERQEAMLDAVTAPLTETERRMLWLCAGYGASREAAGLALGLSKDQANDLFEDMLVKVKNARRQVLGAEVAMSI